MSRECAEKYDSNSSEESIEEFSFYDIVQVELEVSGPPRSRTSRIPIRRVRNHSRKSSDVSNWLSSINSYSLIAASQESQDGPTTLGMAWSLQANCLMSSGI